MTRGCVGVSDSVFPSVKVNHKMSICIGRRQVYIFITKNVRILALTWLLYRMHTKIQLKNMDEDSFIYKWEKDCTCLKRLRDIFPAVLPLLYCLVSCSYLTFNPFQHSTYLLVPAKTAAASSDRCNTFKNRQDQTPPKFASIFAGFRIGHFSSKHFNLTELKIKSKFVLCLKG